MPSSKAAASEEARRYVPHFVGPFAPRMNPGERKSPFSASDFRKTLVEPLSEARTLHGNRHVSASRGWAGEKGDFLSTLLCRNCPFRSRRDMPRVLAHYAGGVAG